MKQTEDPRFLGALQLVNRNGAKAFQLRYSDDEEPTVWMAVAEFTLDAEGHVVQNGEKAYFEVAAALSPLVAMFRLCGQLMDGGLCKHCGRPTGFDEDFGAMPLDDVVCWYQWDPERELFRRGCE